MLPAKTESLLENDAIWWLICLVVIALVYLAMRYVRGEAREQRLARWAQEDAEREAAARNLPEPEDPRNLP